MKKECLGMQEEGGRFRKEREVCEKKKLTNSIGMEFLKIPAGEFKMGSNGCDFEKPIHTVKIPKPFYLGKYTVTQKQWKAVMGNNPSDFKDDDRPVGQVSWNDVQEFVRKLNEMEGTDEYRLPSEAEWEYGCRAGTTTRYLFGDDASDLDDYAWWDKNSGCTTHPVGQKKPNPWGLYDVHGNVWEWCQDEWHDDYTGAPDDGSSWEDGSSSDRIIRGGGLGVEAWYCRSAFRYYFQPDGRGSPVGFRLLRKI
ncbi:formylglycine-generating enzyme family protein [Methanolobus vulcani]|uniref:Formylglycine-generating enzyme family protein n=1 Tax=Methanolobus vulcani TaxID=38026 RepID=A0A7Z8P2N8_9EURY|nr:formylglycine-generating enzyme family protein [Methanolobus vulcani]TQD29544.1 formylglycine-generating enzyme family protein [Methanolobus vulcani]